MTWQLWAVCHQLHKKQTTKKLCDCFVMLQLMTSYHLCSAFQYNKRHMLYDCLCVSVSGLSIVFEGSREDYFTDLMSWAEENNASCDGFMVTNFGTEGYGLRATRDVKVSSAHWWSLLFLTCKNIKVSPVLKSISNPSSPVQNRPQICA